MDKVVDKVVNKRLTRWWTKWWTRWLTRQKSKQFIQDFLNYFRGWCLTCMKIYEAYLKSHFYEAYILDEYQNPNNFFSASSDFLFFVFILGITDVCGVPIYVYR